MSDTEMGNEVEDVSFLPGPGHGGASKRAVYEPKGSQRCKQVVCSQNRAIAIVALFTVLALAIALIAAFAHPGAPFCTDAPAASETPKKKPEAPPTATNGELFPWKDIRLPKAILPTAYTIHMHPNLTSFRFQGNVTIELHVNKATDFIVLHSKNLNISAYSVVHYGTTQKITTKKMLEFPRFEQIYIKLGETLLGGNKYQLKLSFAGSLISGLDGFYRSSYKTAGGETRWLATTQFEPTSARQAFPCFDEPQLKAYFSMFMVRDKDHISLFNMPQKEAVPYGQDLMLDKFETTVRMSTYLVAFVVCDFAVLTNMTSKGTNVSVYAPKDQINQTHFALEAATAILEYYEQFFGEPYPLPKQDLVAVPDFNAGAMENWGLITYRMTYVMYDKKETPLSGKVNVALVVAHELAHQWFGNLVTMEWWNDLWLNEGFASFVEYIGVNMLAPQWKMMDAFLTSSYQVALAKDSLSNSHPISAEVKDPKEINQLFDAISYSKGASIIRMMKSFIGEEAFQLGLKQYLTAYKYENAVTANLWDKLSEAMPAESKINVGDVMDTWTLQMGYPLLNLVRIGDQVSVTQERFLLDPTSVNASAKSESPYSYLWEVPVNYITNEELYTPGAHQVHWMHRTGVSFAVSMTTKWLKLNINQTGLYRVNYPEENWRAIIAQLNKDHTVFSAADRAGLIDDIFALTWSGHVKASLALDLTEYVRKETEFVPLSTALVNLAQIGHLLMDRPVYEEFSKYILHIVRPRNTQLDWNEDSDYLKVSLLTLVIDTLISHEDPPATFRAKELFKNWMTSNKKFPQELKNVVYKCAVMYGGKEEWNFLWEKFKKSLVPSEKVIILRALTKSKDIEQLNRFLHMSLDENQIKTQDGPAVVIGVSTNPSGKILAWRFLRQNYQKFLEKYGDNAFGFGSIIYAVTSGFTTEFDYNEVKAFFETHKTHSASRSIKQSLERIQMNIRALKNNEKEIKNWLETHEEKHNVERRHAEL